MGGLPDDRDKEAHGGLHRMKTRSMHVNYGETADTGALNVIAVGRKGALHAGSRRRL